MEKYLKKTLSSPCSASNKRTRPDTTPPEQWKQPKKFIANPKDSSMDNAMPTSNRFSELPVDDHEKDSDVFLSATKKKPGNNTPPIVIEIGGEWTHQKVKATLEKYVKDFHMIYRGQKIVKAQCYSAKSHQILKESLLKEKVAFHTFSRKDEKQPKAVIKGLPKFLQANIPEELATLGFPGANASELKTLFPSECPPVLIQLPSGTNMAKFKLIKYLSNCSIDVERYKPSKKAGTQCFRCQGFGHASRNCNRLPRCVKCAQSHPTWECAKKDRETPALCCNCQEDHPANFALCKERQKYIKRIESRRETLRKTLVPDAAHAALNVPSTWAQITHSGTSRKLPADNRIETLISPDMNISEKPSGPSQLSKTLKKQAQPSTLVGATAEIIPYDPETMEMLEILTTIQSIKKEFIKCENFMQKVILILTHLGHYV